MSESTTQDATDGAALRRLKEALAERAPRYRGYTLDLNDDGSFELTVRVQDGRIVGAHGATIAEVADICQVSLASATE